MLTGMTEQDWLITLEVFDAVQSRRGEPGHDDRKFLEAIQYFTVHSITWRALPREFGNWNSVWKRFWRLSRSGVFEAFFQMLAEFSDTAHLVQFFDGMTVRAHVSAAGAKGGSSIRPSAARVAAFRPKSTSRLRGSLRRSQCAPYAITVLQQQQDAMARDVARRACDKNQITDHLSTLRLVLFLGAKAQTFAPWCFTTTCTHAVVLLLVYDLSCRERGATSGAYTA